MAGLDAGDEFGESGLEFCADKSHVVSRCSQLVYEQHRVQDWLYDPYNRHVHASILCDPSRILQAE